MSEQVDFVARYANAIGLDIRVRTVLVEGTTDVDLFRLAADFERRTTGISLLDGDFAVCACGIGDLGGTSGIIRELVCLRGYARADLLPNGRPRYRFVGLFDNDKSGRHAVKAIKEIDGSILEFKDVFRLWPVMPLTSNLDPTGMQRLFERENAAYAGLDWELEDLLPRGFVDAFLVDNPAVMSRAAECAGRIHRDLTRDGKARLHRFTKEYAMRDDLKNVMEVLRALRRYLGLFEPPARSEAVPSRRVK